MRRFGGRRATPGAQSELRAAASPRAAGVPAAARGARGAGRGQPRARLRRWRARQRGQRCRPLAHRRRLVDRDPWERDEWDVALAGGALYRIFCDRPRRWAADWFVRGRATTRRQLEYVELHARSAFSFLEGASVPEELAAALRGARHARHGALDRDGVYGAPRFHMAAKKAGVRAHIGAEITCTDGRTYPLLAETREGYQNLCRLITRMKLRAQKGRGRGHARRNSRSSRAG